MKQYLSLCFLVMSIAAVAACSSKVSTYTCTPACPKDQKCGPTGCTLTNPGPDLAVSIDMAMLPCGGACGGTTPYCKAGQCVVCLTDDNCPAGQLCKATGVTTICAPGCNDDARCNAGGQGSLKCCNGDCIDTTTDPRNCGACGTACMLPNDGTSCTGSACTAGTCTPGYGDCNSDSTDGCEVNLTTDVTNCAACGKVCSFKNAQSGCSGTGCYLKACAFGFDDCDSDVNTGCETGTLSDPKNCGGCGVHCPSLPHAVNVCANANCQLTSCSAGYGNCNNVNKDGCEVALLTDVNNCGGCGTACPKGQVCKGGGCTCPQCNFPNAKSDCINNVCALTKCVAGWGNCDGIDKNGCETDLSADPSNCSACGHVCDGLTNYCNAGMCTDNPCTGQVGGSIGAIMGTPMYGFCWYLGIGGANCDQVCADSGGENMAADASVAFDDDCNGGADGQPATWFFNNANSCDWTHPNGAKTGYHTVGHGYSTLDPSVSRQGVYIGKCNDNSLLLSCGTFPMSMNDDNTRCTVCACSH